MSPVVQLQMLDLELQHLPIRRPPLIQLFADIENLLVQAQFIRTCDELAGIEGGDVTVEQLLEDGQCFLCPLELHQ